MGKAIWTLEALKEHFDTRLADADRRYEQRFVDGKMAVDAALTAAKEAVLKAEVASEKRFEGVNEFRATLSDQASHFMTRAEAIQRADANAEKISDLASRFDRLEGRSQGVDKNSTDYRLWIVAGLAAIAVVISVVEKLR